jgi:hypothetical protein
MGCDFRQLICNHKLQPIHKIVHSNAISNKSVGTRIAARTQNCMHERWNHLRLKDEIIQIVCPTIAAGTQNCAFNTICIKILRIKDEIILDWKMKSCTQNCAFKAHSLYIKQLLFCVAFKTKQSRDRLFLYNQSLAIKRGHSFINIKGIPRQEGWILVQFW